VPLEHLTPLRRGHGSRGSTLMVALPGRHTGGEIFSPDSWDSAAHTARYQAAGNAAGKNDAGRVRRILSFAAARTTTNR
jgi:hypothetical protein